MIGFLLRLGSCIMAVAVAACSQIDTGCAPAGAVTPLCGVQMPEDLEVLPDGGGLLIGEYGDGGKLPGALTWLQPDAGAGFVRLADSTSVTRGASQLNWGDAACTAPDTLSPHGIHLSRRGDLLQLLVVNHGSAEQVLFYEVQPSPDSLTPPTLAWRGCVTFPAGVVLNDVVALPDGGLAVTSMYERENELLAQLKSALGLNQGQVWRWTPGAPVRAMANTSARMPNGIAIAPDGKSIFVNNYLEGELRQYELATEQLLSSVAVPNIDNSAWLADGRLLLASHTSPLTLLPCFGLTQGSCGAAYELVAVDTRSGATEVIFREAAGGPFGPATVAVEYQGALYAGSFSGDRLARITP